RSAFDGMSPFGVVTTRTSRKGAWTPSGDDVVDVASDLLLTGTPDQLGLLFRRDARGRRQGEILDLRSPDGVVRDAPVDTEPWPMEPDDAASSVPTGWIARSVAPLADGVALLVETSTPPLGDEPSRDLEALVLVRGERVEVG